MNLSDAIDTLNQTAYDRQFTPIECDALKAVEQALAGDGGKVETMPIPQDVATMAQTANVIISGLQSDLATQSAQLARVAEVLRGIANSVKLTEDEWKNAPLMRLQAILRNVSAAAARAISEMEG